MLKRIFPFLKIRSRESLALYLSMLVMGACGLAYQYTLSKIASNLLGNSVKQWAIIIGVMMFFMGLGADIQKYMSNKKLFDKFIVVEILLGIIGGFSSIALIYFFGTFSTHYALIQYFFISAIGLLIGFEIPLLTRINEHYTNELSLNLGNILTMDYVGSLSGALIWIFLLPKIFDFSQISFVLGLMNIAVAIFTLFFFKKVIPDWKPVLGFGIFGLAVLIFGFFSVGKWTAYSEQFLYKDKIIYSKTTPYQHIVITRSSSNDIYCYINGNLQFCSYDEHIYHENLVHPIFQIAPKKNNVLILGGGDGLALREVLKYQEVVSVTLCDIDPEMTDLAKNHPVFSKLNHNSLENSKVKTIKNNQLTPGYQQQVSIINQNDPFAPEPNPVAKINVINMDAEIFLQQISGFYDIIIIDFPDPNNPELAKLYSKKFYKNIYKKLSKNGLFVQQSSSPFYARETFLCIGRTIHASGLNAIPYHDNVPSFGEWGFWIGGKKGSVNDSILTQQLKKIQTLNIPTQYLNAKIISANLEFSENWLLTNNKKINTILNNEIYQLYLKDWKRYY